MIVSTPCADDAVDQRLVAGLADDQRHTLGHGPLEAGREIIEHDDVLAGIDQLIDHVAADIPGAASDQDRHVFEPPVLSWPTRICQMPG
jgi:hypothetical protein